MFDNLPPVPFNISVERLTEDSNSQRLQNGTIWSSYTEIIDTEFTYPNSAVAGISFDSEYFNNIPTRNYLIKAKKSKCQAIMIQLNALTPAFGTAHLKLRGRTTLLGKFTI
ncbi:hypothetical protein [Mannheimia haemolytica]|uniref:TipJ family phage tail tip protein n=1 Tax=Mannheimia haemolytica TaxID=75985 RepID=UPI0038F6541F